MIVKFKVGSLYANVITVKREIYTFYSMLKSSIYWKKDIFENYFTLFDIFVVSLESLMLSLLIIIPCILDVIYFGTFGTKEYCVFIYLDIIPNFIFLIWVFLAFFIKTF